ncbi:UNKNOWN [Stylonychia lemnae]|uniref:EamA domain-containing protein n=1 Tax=Stylonychia lemnae TaxID=5949 RepID=A0A078AQH9_STYLE|nr:UNKNOWN [Stylonychia lemnae]|eukprot:CDW83507.1 UNKNOWN [Stylonychia lemnae]
MSEQELHLINHDKSKPIKELYKENTEYKSIYDTESPSKMTPQVQVKREIPVAKKVYYIESIFSAMLWGIANFFYSLLDDTDFATSCLTFPGFLFICLGYKILQIKEQQSITKKVIYDSFFGKYYDDSGTKLNLLNIFHMMLRSAMFFGLSWLVILASGYASQAQINFGIITSCISFSIVLSAIFSYIFYNEALNKIQIVGIAIIILGIVGISFAKGNKSLGEVDNGFTEDEKSYYKIVSILLALFCGVVNFLRTFQAKYIYRKTGYQPVDLSVDCGLFLGLFTMVCSIYYWATGCNTYTWYNFGINTIGSIIMMIFSIIALKCIVKGLAGPTGAIMYTCPIYTSILTAIFLKQIPSLYQIMASILAISGVGVILLGNKN